MKDLITNFTFQIKKSFLSNVRNKNILYNNFIF